MSDLELPGVYSEIRSICEAAGLPGNDIARLLAEHFGGQTVYFQMSASLNRASRDEQIRAEFTGTNHRELARRYQLSEVRIRDIVGPKRCVEMVSGQGRLPGC